MGTGAFPIVTVLLIVILGWAAVGLISSRMTGWALLAQRYRSEEPFSGERVRFCSAAMRYGGHYGNCLTIGVNAQGLFLSLSIPFYMGHPPLFIPWHEITASRKRVLWSNCVELMLGRDPSVPFRIQERLGKKLAALACEAWPKESPA